MEETKQIPQTERILNMLGGASWVCGTSFQKEYMPTYAQRISDLRKRGYDIVSDKCDMLGHSHSGAIAKYKWNDYNGWTNYETWNVALHINNNEYLYASAKTYKTYEKFVANMHNKTAYAKLLEMNNAIEINGDINALNTGNTPKFRLQTIDGVCFLDKKINIKEINETVFKDLLGGN